MPEHDIVAVRVCPCAGRLVPLLGDRSRIVDAALHAQVVGVLAMIPLAAAAAAAGVGRRGARPRTSSGFGGARVCLRSSGFSRFCVVIPSAGISSALAGFDAVEDRPGCIWRTGPVSPMLSRPPVSFWKRDGRRPLLLPNTGPPLVAGVDRRVDGHRPAGGRLRVGCSAGPSIRETTPSVIEISSPPTG